MAGLFGGRSVAWSRMPEDERVRAILRECRRQAEDGRRVETMLINARRQVGEGARWLRVSNALWEAIGDAYGEDEVVDLASKLGLTLGSGRNAWRDKSKTIFLTALATLETYEEAWGVVLKLTTGRERDYLLKIRQLEDDVNLAVREGVAGATVCIRGTNIDDATKMREGTAEPNRGYSFVSTTTVLLEAARFAAIRDRPFVNRQVIMFMDALRMRDLGAELAQYSMAAEALLWKRRDESALRMFRLRFAGEMQVHFDVGWPAAASDALLAISPIGMPNTYVLDGMKRLRVPVISLDGV